jgi:glycolate oxidase iron-sulfur subunit
MADESTQSLSLVNILSETEHCNKCGFCLPACPTYRITGQELHSPRGRIAMVEAAAREELPDWHGLEEALSFCVGCRACEPACPSGVHYERILEAGRTALIKRGSVAFRGSLAGRGARYLSQHRTTFGQLARLGRRWGKWVPNVGIGPDLLSMLPTSGDPRPSTPPPRRPSPVGTGPRVGFFTGCVMDSVFSEANRAAMGLLTAAGFRVEVVAGQTCCGAIHLHSGETHAARAMAQDNIRAFEARDWDYVANAAGGCGAMLQEYGELFANDAVWRDRAERFASKVRDFATLLVHDAPIRLTYRGNGLRVALQNSCHLANVQRTAADPVSLITEVQGDTLIHFRSEAMCCGSGGLYNMNHPDWATAILDEKMTQLAPVRPQRILVNNPGCQLQMQAGVSRHTEVHATVEHLATYLWRAYCASDSAQEA